MKRIKHMNHIVLASVVATAVAGCEMGEEYEPFDDVEAGIVVLEGTELVRMICC